MTPARRPRLPGARLVCRRLARLAAAGSPMGPARRAAARRLRPRAAAGPRPVGSLRPGAPPPADPRLAAHLPGVDARRRGGGGRPRVTAVIGNSLGWYTALAAAGALPFDDAFRLVQEMAILQQEPLPSGGPGGQVIYPLADAAWRPDPQLHAAVAAALSDPATNGDGHVHESIDLGAYAVLAGDEAGVARLLGRLAPVRVGERMFPLRLSQHGPYHTPLVAHVAEAAPRRARRPGLARPVGDHDRRARRALDAVVDRSCRAARLHPGRAGDDPLPIRASACASRCARRRPTCWCCPDRATRWAASAAS